MKMRIALAGVVALLGVAGLAAQKPGAEFDKIAAQYLAAFNKADTKAIAAMYKSDALRVTPDGQLFTGRAAIEQNYVASFQGPFKGAKLTLQTGGSQMLGPDVGLMEGTYEVTGSGAPIRGRYVNTLVREGGKWMLASVVTVPEMPAPPK